MNTTTSKTKNEFSAGGVVFRRFTTHDSSFTTYYLLGKHSGYHKWVLPKGMIETGETAQQTAGREVKEEMGIEARIVLEEPLSIETYTYQAELKRDASDQMEDTRKQPIRRVKTYQEDPEFETKTEKVNVFKTVTWFLMEWVSGDPKDHDWEMEEAGWYRIEEAIEMLSFEGERLALQKARDTISK